MQKLTWSLVDKTAEELGVQDWARLKWRQRRVPHVWRIKIYETLAAKMIIINLADFETLPITPGRIAS